MSEHNAPKVPSGEDTRQPTEFIRKLSFWPVAPRRSFPTISQTGLPAQRTSADIDYEAIEGERRARALIMWSLAIVVVIPTLIAGIYLFCFASDQYIAEARFAVRTIAEDTSKQGQALPNVLTMLGMPSAQDADVVADYIQSRAIVDDVSRKIDLTNIFRRPEADFYARLENGSPIETLTKYWREMVSVDIDNMSGIVTVQARAFRRDDALTLVNAILVSSETLVDNLSKHVRADIVTRAQDEFDRSQKMVHASLVALQNYRDAEGILDPVKSADANGKLLLQLMGDKIQLESQLFVSQRTTGLDAPGVAPLRARLDSIDTQITRLQQQMAGTTEAKSNFAALLSKYEELDLNRQFAERLYALTQEGLTRARLLADRRMVYLAVFVPPSLPEKSTYPLRWSSLLLIGVCAFLSWCCGATIWASVLDHQL